MYMTRYLSAFRAAFIDVPYVAKFLLRLLAFYLLFRSINWLWIGLIVPGGYYSPFVEHYLNYVTLIKVSVLQTASWLAHLFGVSSYLTDSSHLQITGSRRVFMAWACTGLEIMSFWAAFCLADTTPRRKKMYWCLGGLFCIWLINCIRVALLVVAVKHDWPQIGTIRHHDTFNAVAYSFVFLLMFVYYRRNKTAMGL